MEVIIAGFAPVCRVKARVILVSPQSSVACFVVEMALLLSAGARLISRDLSVLSACLVIEMPVLLFVGAWQSSRARAEFLSASAAVQRFIARLAACGSFVLRAFLEDISKDSGLGWPFQIPSALQWALSASSSSTLQPLDLLLGSPEDHSTQTLLEASSAITYHTSRHMFLFFGNARAEARAVKMFGAWMTSMQASGHSSPIASSNAASQQLHDAQQLEAVCAALRSAAAATSAAPASNAAEPVQGMKG